MMKLLSSWKRRCRELRERFRAPAVRDQILYRSVRRFSWNKTLLAILIMAVVTMGTVFLFFNLVTRTMKRNVHQSLEQTGLLICLSPAPESALAFSGFPCCSCPLPPLLAPSL